MHETRPSFLDLWLLLSVACPFVMDLLLLLPVIRPFVLDWLIHRLHKLRLALLPLELSQTRLSCQFFRVKEFNAAVDEIRTLVVVKGHFIGAV
jgi:hypothetical protein